MSSVGPKARSDPVLLRRTGPASSRRARPGRRRAPDGAVNRPPNPDGTALASPRAVGSARADPPVVLAFRGCLDSRKEQAIKDYVRDVGALVAGVRPAERRAVRAARPTTRASDEVEITNALNAFGVQSGQLVDRAAGLDHPDELDTAQRLPGRDAASSAGTASRTSPRSCPRRSPTSGDRSEGTESSRRRDAELPRPAT